MPRGSTPGGLFRSQVADLQICRCLRAACSWHGTIAACAFAALLLMVIRSGAVEGLVTTVITTALSVSL
ncbi:DUF4244 domain-containing protein [Ornithinimicrobium humiphilum]|uniref:DUF4244 domain-containing protein n=1 Tax=Ornithinimicrobium humiphilum TaxID=125288 RepID=UPI0014787703|nr:DUF4244 domain-containing protein [Ornithinimicrobium humiphilum]